MFQLLWLAQYFVGFAREQQLIGVLGLGNANVAMFNSGELVDFIKVPRDVNIFREKVSNVKSVLFQAIDDVFYAVGQVIHG